MKSTIVTVFATFVVGLLACSEPAENKERTAACATISNAKACGQCCKTKKSTFKLDGVNGVCTCLGDPE